MGRKYQLTPINALLWKRAGGGGVFPGTMIGSLWSGLRHRKKSAAPLPCFIAWAAFR
jgi:hypothetical protein